MDKTLKDLFVDEIKDLYNAERQLAKSLPQMAFKATSEDLKDAFKNHLKETETQITRLEEVFEELEMNPTGKKCIAMDGILEASKVIMDEYYESRALDAALISAVQKVDHYEIASYGTVRTYAEQLNFPKSADLLQETLIEKSAANEKLNDLAQDHINYEAVEGYENHFKY